MGQAPATGRIGLRTVPRNFPGRSGTREDQVCLVSPETAVASALKGVITDPRTLQVPYPKVSDPDTPLLNVEMLLPPLKLEEARKTQLIKGPNIAALPAFEPILDDVQLPVLLKLGDDISTDEIMPAGARVLPYRSNIPKISQFVFEGIDPSYAQRAQQAQGGHAIVAGNNYGQGSSREHAALAPRYLGLRIVIAKGFARIHWQNLIDYGVLPLTFEDPSEYGRLESGHILHFQNLHQQLREGQHVAVHNPTTERRFSLHHGLSERQVAILASGGLINWLNWNSWMKSHSLPSQPLHG
jgi:aconitate hydratase